MIASRFPFASRLASVRAAMKDALLDALVVTHPPNVRYLSAFSGSTGALVVEQERCALVVDFRYVTSARDIPRQHPDLETLEILLTERNEDDAVVGRLAASGSQRIGIEASWMPVARFNRLSAALAATAPTPLQAEKPCPALVSTERMVERARMVKDGVEIALLRTAAQMLSQVARETLPRLIRPGRRETDVAADIDAALRDVGFQRPAFDTIVASGPNSALPHARPGPRALSPGDPVVLDFGGVYDGYCVDLTRTVQLAPASMAFRRLFAAVADAHAAACAAVRPGILTTDIDSAARDALHQRGLGDAFGHGTGHGLGLEVHEDPRISKSDPARPAVPVAPGMVFTIEPGVYLPTVGGVRIEDDVLVVEGGCEMLTQVPIELA
jgi:Xaa-Pro aminopeptidase